MAANWRLLRKCLARAYAGGEIPPAEEDYLENAFTCTEELWEKQFNKFESKPLRLILLAEAPLFGTNKAYIYNLKTSLTPFFHFNDLAPLLDCVPKAPKDQGEKKKLFVELLARAGVLIVDVFPFALNSKNTSVSFREMSKETYGKLAKCAIESYLAPKLKRIRQRSSGQFVFAFRYACVWNAAHEPIEKLLRNLCMLGTNQEVISIHGNNRWLDRDELKRTADMLKAGR